MTLDDEVRRLHDHLAATEELPVTPTAGRWLGEAAAIAADLVDGDLPDSVVVERVRRVSELLDEVDTTGNDVADERVADAERVAESVLSSAEE